MALFSVNLKKRTPAPTVNDNTVIFGAAGGMTDETPEPFTVATLWAHLVTKIAGSPFGLSLLSLASAAALRAAIALPNTTVVGRLARYTDANGSQGQTAGLFEDATGNVGIGTTAPQRPLDISVGGTSYGQGGYGGQTAAIFRSTASTGSNSRISITSGNVGVSIIDFGDTDGDRGSVQYIHNGDAMAFIANAVERMRIDGSGRVGVGTNAPTARLDNAGDTYRQRTTRTPSSSTAAGNAGDICWDADFLYICVATNTWKRSALATW